MSRSAVTMIYSLSHLTFSSHFRFVQLFDYTLHLSHTITGCQFICRWIFFRASLNNFNLPYLKWTPLPPERSLAHTCNRAELLVTIVLLFSHSRTQWQSNTCQTSLLNVMNLAGRAKGSRLGNCPCINFCLDKGWENRRTELSYNSIPWNPTISDRAISFQFRNLNITVRSQIIQNFEYSLIS